MRTLQVRRMTAARVVDCVLRVPEDADGRGIILNAGALDFMSVIWNVDLGPMAMDEKEHDRGQGFQGFFDQNSGRYPWRNRAKPFCGPVG